MERPPKVLKREIRGLSRKGDQDFEDFDGPEVEDVVEDAEYEPAVYTEAETGVALQPSHALTAESAEALSVLESLRDFLEAERARSRNRTLMLAAVFSVLLLLSIMGGLMMIERLRQQTGAHIGRLDRQQEQTLGLQNEATRLMAEITSKTKALESELKNAGQQRSDAEALMVTQMERQTEGFQMVRQVLSDVEVQNASLAKDYQRMRSEWASLTNSMMVAVDRNIEDRVASVTAAAAVPVPPRPPVAASSVPPEVEEPAEPVAGTVAATPSAPGPWSPPGGTAAEGEDADHLDMAIRPKGSRRAIPWRLPLP